MNRLMIAGIAGLCAAVSFGLESANIVGYVQKEQLDGAFSRIACFDGVATDVMDIQQIVPKFPDGEEMYSGGVQIMTLTDSTETEFTYIYMTAADAKEVDGIEKAGWFNDGMDTRLSGDNAVAFDPGEGFLVISDIADTTVTFSGEVAQGDTISEIAAGANFCGNNALKPLDIQAIEIGTICSETGVISTPVDDLYSGAFQIMTLTPSTETDATYLYLTAADAKEVDGIEKAGWFNDGMDTRMTGEENGVEFSSGEGFLVISDFDTAYIKIPGNIALN